MKNMLYLAVLPLFLMIYSCTGGNGKTDAIPVPPGLEGMIPLDLTTYGYPVTLFVPDTAEFMALVDFNASGTLEVRVGNDFQVTIAEGSNLALRKSDLATSLVFDPTYLAEDPTGILYSMDAKVAESGVPTQYHFYCTVNVGGVDYEIENAPEADASQEAVTLMYTAAKAMCLSKVAS